MASMQKEFFAKNLKVALVHDFLNQLGGAEKVLEAFAEIFPQAPIYTLLHDKSKLRGKFKGKEIRTSFLQKFPKFFKKKHKLLFPFMPTAPETFNLRDFDLVLSSCGAYAKGIVVKPATTHICYMHSPMRYVWDWNDEYLGELKLSGRKKILTRLILNYVRTWDFAAADRPDFIIANSKTTQAKIKKYYGRESEVVYPPVDVEWLQKHNSGEDGKARKKKNYFLLVSRLAPYKKIDLAIETLKKLNLPLVVIGEGPKKHENYLKSIAGPETKLMGWLPDEEIREYYYNCRACLFPPDDDFGIVPVEAMACGRPVIALRKGGATETVIEGETGEFFDEFALETMADAIRRFIEKEEHYSPEKIQEHARKFSKSVFFEKMEATIASMIRGKQSHD